MNSPSQGLLRASVGRWLPEPREWEAVQGPPPPPALWEACPVLAAPPRGSLASPQAYLEPGVRSGGALPSPCALSICCFPTWRLL